MLGPFDHPSQDRPIRMPEQDRLDRGPFVSSLVRALVRISRDKDGNVEGPLATGFVVGLTGKWGLGKSSVLQLLALELGSMNQVIVSVFNPWLFNGRDELLAGFFNGLRDALGLSNAEHAREITDALNRYWGAITIAGHAVAAAVDAHGGAGTATKFWQRSLSIGKSVLPSTKITPERARRELEDKLAKRQLAVVVLIDELDRVEDSEVRAVAQLIKAVGDIKGISYLVAYDAERVTDALGRGDGANRKTVGAQYLEKIIQMPIPLRPLFTEDIDALLSAELEHAGVASPQTTSENESSILNQVKNEIATPRDVKRLAGSYAVLSEIARGEIADADVLAYSWILIKSPSLQEIISQNPDKFVVDPASAEQIARIMMYDREKEPSVTPEKIIGSAAAQHSKLLELLFPRFGEIKADKDSPMRLHYRRNLVRLLYLGNPPGAVSRSELDGLWAISDKAELISRLCTIQNDGRLQALIDRLDDFWHLLPQDGDQFFWPALSFLLTAKRDWQNTNPEVQAVSKDAAEVIMHVGQRDDEGAKRAKQAIETLISEGDLAISPGVIRTHLFRHGLTHHSSGRSGDWFYDKGDTLHLTYREFPRYKAAIMDGYALRRLPNLEVLYALSNANQWSDELRSSLTAQLSGLDAISTAASLFVPPGYGSDLSFFESLFDSKKVKDEVSRVEEATEALDAWHKAAFRNFSSILRGEDSFGVSDPDD